MISIEGPGKSGKTDLALEFPGPLLYLPFDVRWRDTLKKKIAAGKKIHLSEAQCFTSVFEGLDKDKIQATATENWNAFSAALVAGAKSRKFRGFVIDTASEAFHTFTCASYGKTSQIPQHMWGPLYFAFCNALRTAVDGAPGAHIILIHQVKDEYVDTGSVDKDGKKVSKKTGELIRDGCKKMEYFIDTVVRMRHAPGENQFFARFDACAPNMRLVGSEIEIPEDIGAMTLLSEMFPDADPAQWEDQ